MHEATVAQAVLGAILAEAENQKARPIAAAISCGVLNAINDDVLLFAFEAIAKGTACEGLKLNIEHKPIEGKCRRCSQVFEFDIAKPSCGKCGGDDFELLPDAPLILEEIEFETQ